MGLTVRNAVIDHNIVMKHGPSFCLRQTRARPPTPYHATRRVFRTPKRDFRLFDIFPLTVYAISTTPSTPHLTVNRDGGWSTALSADIRAYRCTITISVVDYVYNNRPLGPVKVTRVYCWVKKNVFPERFISCIQYSR